MIYLWVDESDKHGSFYSNFYGGILIHSRVSSRKNMSGGKS